MDRYLEPRLYTYGSLAMASSRRDRRYREPKDVYHNDLYFDIAALRRQDMRNQAAH